MSHFTRAYTEFADLVKYEARLYVDGRLVAYVLPESRTHWKTNMHILQVHVPKSRDLLATRHCAHMRSVRSSPLA